MKIYPKVVHMKKALLLSVILSGAFFFTACDSDVENPGKDSRMTSLIQEAVDNVLEDFGVPGALVGVWEEGRAPIVVARGVAETTSNRAMAPEATFRIASVTKTFTATIILMLADQGTLSLDDTLDKFLPQVPNSDSITIRQLLGMTAGVYDFFYHDPDVSWSYIHDPLRRWPNQELFDLLIGFPPDFPPGDRCVYSNAEYFLLGLIAEQATGTPLEELVQAKIINPLGLSRTFFPTTPNMPLGSIHGYRDSLEGEGLEDITRVDPSLPWAGGAVISSLPDLSFWAAALYNGDLLSPAMQEERLKYNTMNGCLRYGLGIMDLCGFIGHNGEILGFANYTCYLPEKKASIVVMVNKCNDDGQGASPSLEIFKKVTKILYPDNVVW